MSPLPVLSGRDVIRALERIGFETDRQKGNHVVLRNRNPPFRRITVPDHRELAKGTLRAIIRETGLTVDEFAALSK